MKKIVTLMVAAILCTAITVSAQVRQITGRIVDEKGMGVSSASVQIKGTKLGTTADPDGRFRINAQTGNVLVISSLNFKLKEVTVGSGSVVDVALESDLTLSETVVTALGIRRKPKEVGYANTTVKADQITSGKSPTLGQALSGKVAGLTIYNQNASISNDVRVVLRGNRSINGNNQALIVLDGVPVPQNTISYINPDDIENVTVLKGGQAATLYGSDGVNGVLMITTKKGNSKPVVNFSHTSSAESVSFLPKMQTQFGSGSDYGGTPLSIDNFRPFENQSYGDAYNGQLRDIGRVLEDGSHLQLPYSAVPNMVRNAFNVGYTMQNNLSLSGGDDNSNFFMSVQDYMAKGVVPNDEYHRTSFRFNSSRTFGKLKIGFDGNYTIDRTQRTNADFYGNLLQTPNWFNVTDYRDWQTNKFANPNGYFNDYTNNPYFLIDNNRRDQKSGYFNGNLNLELKAASWLTFNYRLGTAVTNTFTKDYVPVFKYTTYARVTAPTFVAAFNDYNGINRAKTDALGSVADQASNGTRVNSDFLVTLSKNFKDFSTKLILGNSIQTRTSSDERAASTSLLIPGVYSITNRAGDLDAASDKTFANQTNQRKYGFFGDLTVGYKNWLFLHGSGRNDNTSLFFSPTRDASLYSYWYYGVDASAVLTDALPSMKSDWLSFLKLRVSYGLNRNDNLNPYDLTLTYASAGGFPYGTTVGTVLGTTLPDPGLQPEKVTSYEGGFEMGMFKNKVNLDFSIYKSKTEGSIISTGISNGTGYSNYRVNAAGLDNTGIEVELRANIISRKNFSWDVNANYTYNTNKVTQIFRDLPRFQSGSIGTAGFLFAEIGLPFPYLKTTGYLRDNGRVVVDATNAFPVKDPNQIAQGNTLPKHTVGFGTKLTYKAFTFATNLELRAGYKVYNGLAGSLAFNGLGAKTVEYNRAPYLFPNSVVDDGTGKYVTNTKLVSAYYAWYAGNGDVGTPTGLAAIGETNVTSGFFLKMRDISISYTLPAAWLTKTKVFKGASITAFGRNVFTIVAKDNIYTDPEFNAFGTASNNIGINTAANNTPPVRSLGATLSLTF